MRAAHRFVTGMCLFAALAGAVIIDRIAIIVNKSVIKDSDIERDIRLTDYLNGDPLSFTPADRKKAAARLIDQAIILREIQVGAYEPASPAEVDDFLRTVRKQRTDPLAKYGLTDQELRGRVTWQITVLHFIEERFRPAILVTEADIEKYAKEHPTVAHDQIQDQIAGQRVNEAFESWLDRTHKRMTIEYREAGLQ